MPFLMTSGQWPGFGATPRLFKEDADNDSLYLPYFHDGMMGAISSLERLAVSVN